MSKLLTACVLSCLAVTAALPRAAHAFDPPVPCEEFTSDSFRDIFNTPSIRVVDVGDVVKEKGRNLCSVLIDTSLGARVQFFFTTARSVSGAAMWKQVSFKVVPD
jgi:hypothetical protein